MGYCKKGKVWKLSWTAKQCDFYFMPFGSLMVWVSPVLPTYRKPRLLGFWHISCFLLRVSLSYSGCAYPQYSITCLLSRPKRLSCDHCQWRLFSDVIEIYPWEPALSHPTPSPLPLACLFASQVLWQHLARQRVQTGALQEFSVHGIVFSHAEIFSLSCRLHWIVYLTKQVGYEKVVKVYTLCETLHFVNVVSKSILIIFFPLLKFLSTNIQFMHRIKAIKIIFMHILKLF